MLAPDLDYCRGSISSGEMAEAAPSHTSTALLAELWCCDRKQGIVQL